MGADMFTVMFLVPVICIGVLFLAFVMFLHHQHRKFAHIPAPPRESFFTGHLNMLVGYKKRNMCMSDGFIDIMREYGPIFHVFLLFKPMIVVLDAEFVKEILCTDSMLHRKPYHFYAVFMKLFGTRLMGDSILCELNPAVHGPKRLLLNPAFHKRYLVDLMHQFNASADLLIDKLSNKADGKKEVAMLDEFNRTTLDVIAKVAFGMDLNVFDEKSPFTEAVTKCLNGMSTAFNVPFMQLNPFPAARKYKQEVRDSIKCLREAGRKCIEQRLEAMQREDEVPQDILTYILKSVTGVSGKDYKDQMENVIDEFVTFFVAGQETTANLLSFTLLELGHHPEIMHRLKTEVESVCGDRDYLEYSDVVKLSYMMQVLKEALRLWPPVVGTGRELAHDVTVKGYKIPKGSLVAVNTFVMARMEEYFHDPMQFDPDRFNASNDKPQYAYFPFSLGSRNCIGQQFAMIEARVLLAKLLHRFNFNLVPGQGHGVIYDVTLRPFGRCKNYIRPVE
ncbi:cholesterol 24-hydroxylase-like [Asterias rubens]|uniref:cholesterol 24-hydroxylase-like n=1 Tax=Asterias rubens TaxID=7604 RepID=UPI00145526F4|nr:cholesterol 24-hydroxylase-like [Asterias rubens]